MDAEKLLASLQAEPWYAGQIAHVRHEAPVGPSYSDTRQPLSDPMRRVLQSNGISRLYAHQARAFDAWACGRNVVVTTSTTSGKSLCYWLPIVDLLAGEPDSTALLLFPTKALCQDQYRVCQRLLAAGCAHDTQVAIIDGDTPGSARRRLRQCSLEHRVYIRASSVRLGFHAQGLCCAA